MTSMALHKTAVTPLQTHGSYRSLAQMKWPNSSLSVQTPNNEESILMGFRADVNDPKVIHSTIPNTTGVKWLAKASQSFLRNRFPGQPQT